MKFLGALFLGCSLLLGADLNIYYDLDIVVKFHHVVPSPLKQ